MAGGANAKQDLIDKITKLEDARYVRSNFSTQYKRMPNTVSL